MKVLLVDDSSTMRKIQRRTLIKMGIEDITECGNGLEAINELQANPDKYDLMLCDVNMPEMDGFSTLKKVRMMPATCKLPVIMCTSVAEKDQVLKAIKAGANNYVVKPFKPDDLEAKIKATMEKAGKPF